MFNWLDAILVAIIVLAAIVGFFQRFLRQVIALVAIYVGLVIGAEYYPLLADRFHGRDSGILPVSTEVLCFLGIFLLAVAMVIVLGFGAVKDTRLPSGLLAADQLGGAVLGVGVGFAVVIVVCLALGYALQASTANWNILDFMREETGHSSLVPFLLRSSHTVNRLLSPWLPAGLPSILAR